MRELRNLCERLVVLGESREIGREELRAIGLFGDEAPAPKPAEADPGEEELLRLLTQQRMKREDLAKVLGISRTTLWRKLNKLDAK